MIYPHVHFAGFWPVETVHISEYELMGMSHETFQEFKWLLSTLSGVTGLEVTYDAQNRRHCITTLTPVITTMDMNRVEYPDDEE